MIRHNHAAALRLLSDQGTTLVLMMAYRTPQVRASLSALRSLSDQGTPLVLMMAHRTPQAQAFLPSLRLHSLFHLQLPAQDAHAPLLEG